MSNNNKPKNELALLLDNIRKSLNKKSNLSDKDLEKIKDVLEINKIKKEITEKFETASAFKHLESEKILGFFNTIQKVVKNEFENLEIEENLVKEENKKIREKNKKNTEKKEIIETDDFLEKNGAL